MSAQRTSQDSQSFTTEFSSPPTYWIGLRTSGSSGSSRGYTDCTGTVTAYREPPVLALAVPRCPDTPIFTGNPGSCAARLASDPGGAVPAQDQRIANRPGKTRVIRQVKSHPTTALGPRSG